MHVRYARGLAGRARLDPGVWSRWRCVLLSGLLVIAAASSEAQPAPKQVLMLHSLNRGNLVLDQFTGDFRVRLDQQAGKPVNVVQVVVGPTVSSARPNQARRRLRPIDLRRSRAAGPRHDGGRPCRCIRAQASAPAVPRGTAPVRFGGPSIPARRAPGRQRDRGPGRQRLSWPDRRHPARAARHQAGLHGDRVRIARPLLARRARGRVHTVSRSGDLHLVGRAVAAGHPGPRREPSEPLGDRLSRPSARTRKAGRMPTSKCSPTFMPRPMRPCSQRSARCSDMESSVGR